MFQIAMQIVCMCYVLFFFLPQTALHPCSLALTSLAPLLLQPLLPCSQPLLSILALNPARNLCSFALNPCSLALKPCSLALTTLALFLSTLALTTLARKPCCLALRHLCIFWHSLRVCSLRLVAPSSLPCSLWPLASSL
jgi:hypothetical protein